MASESARTVIAPARGSAGASPRLPLPRHWSSQGGPASERDPRTTDRSRTSPHSRAARYSHVARRARPSGRLVGVVIVLAMFGIGFAAIASDARRMHVDRMVNHEIALRDMARD